MAGRGKARRSLDPKYSGPLETALSLWARGLSVIPVLRPQPGACEGAIDDGKHPAIKWREFQTRPPTEHELTAWFADTDHNVAVITGAVSGVVVIDADSPDALRWCVRRLPYTPWQTKTVRGFHLWYGHSGVHVKNRARLDTGTGRLALDVRGDGGYAIAPGSVHASGANATSTPAIGACHARSCHVFGPGGLSAHRDP